MEYVHKPDTAIFATNLRHAARNGETVRAGGGNFNPGELASAAAVLTLTPELATALRAMLDLHKAHHNEPTHAAARALLAKL